MRSLFFFTLLLFFTFNVSAQEHNHSHLDHANIRDGESVEYCVTHKKMEQVLTDPALYQSFLSAKSQLETHEQIQGLNKAGIVYTVPVVFHVLHDGGIENISRAQILDAMEILNTDFRKQNADANSVVAAFQGMPSDVEIEFVLASKAPNGQCFSGVTRTKSSLTVAPAPTSQFDYPGSHQVDAVLDGNDVYQGQWASNKYLNVFVCKDLGGAAGYTFNPGGTNSIFLNSIFMLHNYTGSIGTSSVQLSRALTHEVGHWLNLSHTWGPNNSPGNINSCNDDDGISDTPNTIGVQGCSLTESSCGVLANVENYMDYSYCSKMFTEGQRTRMRSALTSGVSGRNNLWKTSNLNAVGATGVGVMCKAEFSVDQNIVCEGSQLQFTDESYHAPSGWSWTFQGGNPSSSTAQNPLVTYNTPGVYEVNLTASNASGSVSQTKTEYIRVVSSNGIAPLQEGFENISSVPSNNWFVESFHTGNTWEIANGVAYTGNNSVMLKNSENGEGNEDELLSTTINLDLNLSASISFKYAFAKKVNANNDKLIVKVSNNCGETWATKKTLGGSTIQTTSFNSGNFVPTSSEWKTATINSSGLTNYLVSGFRMKFIFQGDGGNNVYIDDINIDGPVSLEENNLVEKLIIYPNPASDEVRISFVNKENNNNFSLKIFDVVGKEIETIVSGELIKGNHNYSLNVRNYSPGIYLVSINDGVRKRIEKLIVE